MGLVGGNQNGDAPPQYTPRHVHVQPPSYRPQARTANPSFRPQRVRQQLGSFAAPVTDRTALIGDHTNGAASPSLMAAASPGRRERLAAAAARVHPRLQGAVMTWASSTFIVVYIVMMGVSLYQNDGIEELSVNPMVGPSVETLNNLGANNAAEMKYRQQIWRLVTPIFLHAGLVHLGFNVYVQSQIGSELEAIWGTATWLMIFLMGGAFGNLASMVFLPTSIGVGASGGIMGLLGGWFLELICHWKDDDPKHFLDPAEAKSARKQRIKQISFLTLNIAITFALSVVPLVDWAAHVGGCIGGMIVSAHFFSADVLGGCSRTCTLWISTAAIIVLSIAGLSTLYQDVEPCPDKGADFTNYLPPTC